MSVGAFLYSLPAVWPQPLAVYTAQAWCGFMNMQGSRHLPTAFTEPATMGKLEERMNWEQFEGKWKQYSGKVKEKWGKLTDDDLQQIAARRDQLVGKIQERYGIAKEQ